MSDRLASPTLVAVVGIPLILFAAYMGSYYAMIKGGARSKDARGVLIIVPDYRLDSEPVHRFLLPAHTIDRFIRPAYWDAVNWVV